MDHKSRKLQESRAASRKSLLKVDHTKELDEDYMALVQGLEVGHNYLQVAPVQG